MATHVDLCFVIKNGGQVISEHPLKVVQPRVQLLFTQVLDGQGTALTDKVWKKLCVWADTDEARVVIEQIATRVGKGYVLYVQFPLL